MAAFATDTRRWLEAAIKQRKFLVRMNKSHKPQGELLKALEELERLLKAYSYSNDLHMARFVCAYSDQILTILPGSGSACCRKKQLEFNAIRYQAMEITPKTINTKTFSYELPF